MEVSDQLHAPATLPPLPFEEEVVWAPELVLSCLVHKTLYLGRPACSPVTIPAAPSLVT